MGALATPRLMGLKTALKLGRISNLPTVWSNVIAATALAGGAPPSLSLAAAAAMSLLYVGGMYLNDAFDRKIDACERASRPIPSGEASATAVFTIGFAALMAGVALLAVLRSASGLAGLPLTATILLYDWRHKDNPLSPLLMGLCRALVYVGAAAALASPFWLPVLLGAGALLFYVAGLTLAAKQERLDRVSNRGPLFLLAMPLLLAPVAAASWLTALVAAALLGVCLYALSLLRRRQSGHAGRAVGLLIASIALVDALAASTVGALNVTLVCFALFGLTLILQRYVPGT
jgi:heme O synthase-like polyprenyltransferase